MHKCLLYTLFILTSSCNGQNQTKQQKDSVSESKTNQSPVGVFLDAPNKAVTYGVNTIVHCALQDKAGNLWFCTSGGVGVYRYDGKVFTNYNEKNGLCNDTVYAVLQDKDGNIWFGIENGVCKYDGKSFTHISIPGAGVVVKPFNAKATNSFSKPATVLSILQDKAGNFWFGTFGGGVYRYDGKTFTNFLNNEGAVYNDEQHHNVIQDILEDKSGNLWFASMSHGAACRYDGKAFTNFTKQDGLDGDMLSCILQDKAGNIWFGSRDDGAFRYDGKGFTKLTTKDGLGNNNVSCMMEDKKGNLWFGSDRGGTSCYDGKTFTHFTTKEGLANNQVRVIFEDKAGNIWFGCRGGGLCSYDGKTFTDHTQKLAAAFKEAAK